MTDAVVAPPIIVFDVECMGLHGEAFSVGAVVWREGREVEALYLECHTGGMDCREVDYAWLRENCLPHRRGMTHPTPGDMRDAFWSFWMRWKAQGAQLWADCGWPCEARFLAACVDDDRDARWWQGPFPLREIGQVFTGDLARTDETKPEHDPPADARHGLAKLRAASPLVLGFSMDAPPVLIAGLD